VTNSRMARAWHDGHGFASLAQCQTLLKEAQLNLRHGVNWLRAQALLERERVAFETSRPKSRTLSAQAARHLLFGVPLHWMNDWSAPFSLYVERAQGARFTDVDGHDYVDFCLGDTGAMFGHSPAPVARALVAQAERGCGAHRRTCMQRRSRDPTTVRMDRKASCTTAFAMLTQC
jgi:hypothetical protein